VPEHVSAKPQRCTRICKVPFNTVVLIKCELKLLMHKRIWTLACSGLEHCKVNKASLYTFA